LKNIPLVENKHTLHIHTLLTQRFIHTANTLCIFPQCDSYISFQTFLMNITACCQWSHFMSSKLHNFKRNCYLRNWGCPRLA